MKTSAPLLPFQLRIHEKIFSTSTETNGYVVSNLTKLLAGADLGSNIDLTQSLRYIVPSSLPAKIQSMLGVDRMAVSQQIQIPFDLSVRDHVVEICERGYHDHMHHYEKLRRYPSEGISELGKKHGILQFLFRHYKDPSKLVMMFDFLNSYMHATDIPTTSLEAFRKYIDRKQKVGLPQCLIHKLTGRPSNFGKVSDFMKDVIVLVATKQTILLSAGMIEREILWIVDSMPNAEGVGVYPVSESKIREYLGTAAATNAIDYAISEPLEFQRRVLGVLSFIRASAPLVKVHVDSYYFQTKYRDHNEVRSFVGTTIYDEFSEYVFDMNLSDSENTESLERAFENFFKRTKGVLPRELAMDSFTYKQLSTGLPRLFKFLTDKGVIINHSSNPNNKSPLELFFERLQQREMPSTIFYLGSGVKSKRRLAHPSRHYKLILSSSIFALDKYEMSRLLTTIWSERYNNRHVKDDSHTPKSRYEEHVANPLCSFDLASTVPYLFYEYHPGIRVTGGTIKIVLDSDEREKPKRKKKSFKNWSARTNKSGNIYKNREFPFLNAANNQFFDVYVDKNNPGTAILYYPDTQTLMGEMQLFVRCPSARYDRTDDDVKEIDKYQVEGQAIRNMLEKADHNRVNQFKEKTGKNFEDLQLRSIQKKELDDADMALLIGLSDPKKEPKLVHLNKSRRRRRLKGNSNDIGLIFTDTI
ncbi:MAG: hypothetical protein OJF59_002843 [Cytophagales bacterium]|jgi:hypothetical protein|nr:hypothetical protein [Bacteroidota bacterium]MBS1981764.1 hypothetical protein [Bacteroidota bacterium]WHZ09088.1 MAG: hypothetical protein OJF59_002843 [Cytophagales bacterium]